MRDLLATEMAFIAGGNQESANKKPFDPAGYDYSFMVSNGIAVGITFGMVDIFFNNAKQPVEAFLLGAIVGATYGAVMMGARYLDWYSFGGTKSKWGPTF